MTDITQGDLLYSGKAKSLYQTNDPRYLISEFRDDTSAFDGAKKASLSHKGQVNHQISTWIFQKLAKASVPTHWVKTISSSQMLVKHLRMLPIECVVRNIAAGSLCKRLGVESGLRLSPPLFELFYKNDDLHDPLINQYHALAFGFATQHELDEMYRWTLKINQVLSALFADAGMILVDAKFEFGVDQEGHICLGDEISPDSCRIWEANTQKPLDKDRFRQDLGEVVESYQIIASKLL